ncbi:hypothetical protein LPJ61_006490 [Coemansia biformis]|uniref:Uncharacterized protein n=1 Tax=Coemansia biformis TaxID=1286918 RepID=A0A9W7XUM7_9FUNG|nr:hypothetical protein LPJ61_006490 [Coemansia biformis]
MRCPISKMLEAQKAAAPRAAGPPSPVSHEKPTDRDEPCAKDLPNCRLSFTAISSLFAGLVVATMDASFFDYMDCPVELPGGDAEAGHVAVPQSPTLSTRTAVGAASHPSGDSQPLSSPRSSASDSLDYTPAQSSPPQPLSPTPQQQPPRKQPLQKQGSSLVDLLN